MPQFAKTLVSIILFAFFIAFNPLAQAQNSDRPISRPQSLAEEIRRAILAPTSLALAQAIDIPPANIISASIGTSSASGTGVGNTPLAGFPIQGTTFSILSTGFATVADDPDTNNGEALGVPNAADDVSAVLSGLNTNQKTDMVRLTITLKPPTGVNGLSFNFQFFSEEFPDYIGSLYNDVFVTQLGKAPYSPTFTISGTTINAPDNIALDTNGEFISVNAAFGFNPLNPNPNTGTTYDGTSGLLTANACLPENLKADDHIVLVFTIADVSDSVLDSAVFLDNFRWRTFENCSNSVVPAQPGTITIIKEANPQSSQIFNFASNKLGNFMLVDNGDLSNQKVFSNIQPDNYTFTESLPDGWRLERIDCGNASGVSVNLDSGALTIELSDGQDIICTFYNEAVGQMTLSKTPSATSVPEPGGPVMFAIYIENTGIIPITITTLTDSVYGNLNGKGNCALPQLIDAGDSYSCDFTADVAGPANATHYNVVTANGTDINGNPITAMDDASVLISNKSASIYVSKTPNITSVPAGGGNVTFTVSVTNTSTADTITITQIEDNSFSTNCALPQILNPNQGFQCQFAGFVTGAAGGQHTNTVTVIGTDDDGGDVFGSAQATVNIEPEIPQECNDPDPDRDLRNDGTFIRGNKVEGQITNLSSVCTYDVGMASYRMFNWDTNSQELFSSASGTAQPNQTIVLSINLPDCAAQIDLFYGTVLSNLDGQRYGPRLLDATFAYVEQWCQAENTENNNHTPPNNGETPDDPELVLTPEVTSELAVEEPTAEETTTP